MKYIIRITLLFIFLFASIGCKRNDAELRDYKFSVSLSDSIFSNVAVGENIETSLIITQQLQEPLYTIFFSFDEEKGEVFFSDKQMTNGESIEIREVKNLRIKYHSSRVGETQVTIKVKNKLLEKEIKLSISAVAKTEVVFPDYSFHETFSPNVNIPLKQSLILNNQSDRENKYSLKVLFLDGKDLSMWILSSDNDKRAINPEESIELLNGLGQKEFLFEVQNNKPGTSKFQFIVTDKYGNTFESKIYELTFETKARVEFPSFKFKESYSPNTPVKPIDFLRIVNLEDQTSIYKIRYEVLGEDKDFSVVMKEGEYTYSLRNKEYVSLKSETGDRKCFFEFTNKRPGVRKFKLEVEDSYGNTYTSDVYEIHFEAKVKISFPKIENRKFQTNVSNESHGGKFYIQGEDDSQNQFYCWFDVMPESEQNGFSMSLLINDKEGIKLGRTNNNKVKIASGTVPQEFDLELTQSKEGKTNFILSVQDEYGNVYHSDMYSIEFENKYYVQFKIEMIPIDTKNPPLFVRDENRQERFNEKYEIPENAKDLNHLKTLFSKAMWWGNNTLKADEERYIYNVLPIIYSDPQLTKKMDYRNTGTTMKISLEAEQNNILLHVYDSDPRNPGKYFNASFQEKQIGKSKLEFVTHPFREKEFTVNLNEKQNIANKKNIPIEWTRYNTGDYLVAVLWKELKSVSISLEGKDNIEIIKDALIYRKELQKAGTLFYWTENFYKKIRMN
ncbi:hypothetical protein [Porphyromonas gingivicanis]|uniref:hypothetical protein n=1 Tax=Porphyromonas gingivicanis TaxID=266762 RepID=UPI00046F8E1C|nr:hypothetical protein [Porphyromonas gingivicanis]